MDPATERLDTYLQEQDTMTEQSTPETATFSELDGAVVAAAPTPQIEDAQPIALASIYDRLVEPFRPDQLHWRIGRKSKDGKKAQILAYLDARDVMGRLDRVVGWQNWADSYQETASGRIICTLILNLNGYRVAKEDAAGDTQVEGEKGAVSDAFKRAAVKFGIGRYLYYLDAPWVPLKNDYGDFDPPQLPKWAIPKG